jgi:hypothetical protein
MRRTGRRREHQAAMIVATVQRPPPQSAIATSRLRQFQTIGKCLVSVTRDRNRPCKYAFNLPA